MQKKPVGESRIPTDYWAGLGFSKSMPGSAIRDGLKQNNVHRYQEPSMSTTYEVGTSIQFDGYLAVTIPEIIIKNDDILLIIRN